MTRRSSNRPDGLSAAIRVRVPFFDLDSAGVVWHGRYFQYFELARRELLEWIGYSYEEMTVSGLIWPVSDANVRYLRPLILNQEILVKATLREWEMRIVIDYLIEDAAGTACTRATTVQVPVDIDTRELAFGSPAMLVDRVSEKLRMRDGPTS